MKFVVFSSLIFLFAFLPLVLLCNYVCPSRFRNAVLLVFSIIFYAWGEPKYIALMLFSIVFDYVNGLLIEKFRLKGQTQKSKGMLIVSVIGNLSILGFFKYADFFISNVNSLVHTDFSLLGIALPIGVSFYTFQIMSYTIDVYRGQVKAQKNIFDFATYVTLFPQLIAGPIVQYKTVAADLISRRETKEQFAYGVKRFVIGLGKKVLLANQIGVLWNQISAMDIGGIPAATAWLGAIAYTFQIYFDFSGYSDMAIGMGKMLGFTFLENFDHPYVSKSITEFWRRWHISLSTWFKEYVYIPLGGNRKGLPCQLVNIMIVWILTGLWHGASWNFVIWGTYFGLLLIVEKCFLLKRLKKLPPFFSHLYSLACIVFGWVIFALTDISDILAYFKAMFGFHHFIDKQFLYLLSSNAVLLVILVIASTEWLPKLFHKGKLGQLRVPWLLQVSENAVMLFIMVLSIAFLLGDTYNPFLYFRF